MAKVEVNIIRFNTFELFEQAMANAATLGLTGVITACYTGDGSFMGGGTVCSDPAGYAFWDTIHPSARSHSILAQELNITLHGWFGDVCSFYWAYDYIQKLSAANVTRGCGNGFYCPEDLVTRAEIAVFIERTIKEDTFLPSPAVGIFIDVPTDYWAAGWIEELYLAGITTGCGENPLRYCPDDGVTRAQMAAFLVRTFGL